VHIARIVHDLGGWHEPGAWWKAHRLTVRLANWQQAPFSHWALHHVRELVPSAEIVNDPADVHEWPLALNDLKFLLSPGHRLAAAVKG